MDSKNWMIIGLQKTPCYKEACDLGDKVWDVVMAWPFFAKDTIGKQLVRSADSISANIAEGFARESAKDKIKFYYYARASASEVIDWITKASKRELISTEVANQLLVQTQQLPKLINYQISYTKDKLKR